MFSSLCARHREREPLSSQPSREDGVKIPIIEMKTLRLSEPFKVVRVIRHPSPLASKAPVLFVTSRCLRVHEPCEQKTGL